MVETFERTVPLFINDRLEMIDDPSSMIDHLLDNGKEVYIPRTEDRASELPCDEDIIVAEAVAPILIDGGKYALKINVIDSLHYNKLKEPVIRINGRCCQAENGKLKITEVLRLSLGDKK